jgi:toxin FitB
VIILDTNVASELMKPAPSLAVTAWVADHAAAGLYTTSITVAEIGYGIERLSEGRRKELLRAAAEEVFTEFSEQVLAFDASAAAHYAFVVSQRDRAGAPIDGFDALITSICRAHDAALATRNGKDFESTGIDVIDPWDHHS